MVVEILYGTWRLNLTDDAMCSYIRSNRCLSRTAFWLSTLRGAADGRNNYAATNTIILAPARRRLFFLKAARPCRSLANQNRAASSAKKEGHVHLRCQLSTKLLRVRKRPFLAGSNTLNTAVRLETYAAPLKRAFVNGLKSSMLGQCGCDLREESESALHSAFTGQSLKSAHNRTFPLHHGWAPLSLVPTIDIAACVSVCVMPTGLW